MNRFWHRRASEAIFLIALLIVGLFVWSLFGESPESALYIPLIPGVLGVITAIFTVIFYFITPRDKLALSITANYFLLTTTLVSINYFANNSASYLFSIPLVIILATGPILGKGGLFVSLLGTFAFIFEQAVIKDIPFDQFILLCLIVGTLVSSAAFIWLRKKSTTLEDQSYSELASRLSQVAGMSDIVISVIGDGVIAVDSKGIIELINPAAQQIIGWGDQDAVGLSYKSVLKIADAKGNLLDDSSDLVQEVLHTNQTIKSEDYMIKTQSDKAFAASISIKPVGSVGQGVVIVFSDITRKKSDDRQRAEFISTASHEMRTPVASIEGYLGLALNPQTATIDARAQSYIAKAHESAQHLGRLFQDLLDISKVDDRRITNNPKVVDVAQFVKDIVEGLTPKAQEKGLIVNFLPDSNASSEQHSAPTKLNPVYYAHVDNDHLREIVQNLFENAIKYTQEGSISVDISGDDNSIVVSIADTGIGIPREDIAHLFQKFYRVDNSDTREIGGTGLGLYLCRRLAEAIGGRIWVESEYKKGSVFYLSVPRVDAMEVSRLISESEQASEPSTKPALQPGFTNTPLSAIESQPDQYINQLRREIKLNVPPRR